MCDKRPVDLLVLLNAMIPSPGESDWWTATGDPVDIGPDFDPVEMFLHDVPDIVRAQAFEHATEQADRPMSEPYPLPRWPSVPTRFVLSAGDRFFPADWPRGVVRDRLGIDPDEIGGGHCVALSRPDELVETFEWLCREEVSSRRAPPSGTAPMA